MSRRKCELFSLCFLEVRNYFVAGNENGSNLSTILAAPSFFNPKVGATSYENVSASDVPKSGEGRPLFFIASTLSRTFLLLVGVNANIGDDRSSLSLS